MINVRFCLNSSKYLSCKYNMSCIDTTCKLITHVELKKLSSFDICGKEPIVPIEQEIKNIEITNSSICNRLNVNLDNRSRIIKLPTIRIKNNKITRPINDNINKRVVSESTAWKNIDVNYLDVNNQFKFIEDSNTITDIVSCELKKKISSYKSQDKRKNMYNCDEFVDFEFILKMFNDSKLVCYYCKCNVLILYDTVRESKQWTLERIDNRLGHNKGNSVIACLECNLKRRTMYHERFIMTKQLRLTKVE